MAKHYEFFGESPTYTSIFKFEHPACKVQTPIDYSDDDKEILGLKVKALKSKTVTLSYKFQYGLTKYVNHKIQESDCPIHELPKSPELEHLLDQLDLSKNVPGWRTRQDNTDIDSKYIEQLKLFFERYGYLFKLSDFDKYEKINPYVTSRLLDRVFILTTLLSECRNPSKNYNLLFFFTFYLIFSEPISVISTKDGRLVYETPMHPCLDHFINDDFRVRPPRRVYSIDELQEEFPDASRLNIYVTRDETDLEPEFDSNIINTVGSESEQPDDSEMLKELSSYISNKHLELIKNTLKDLEAGKLVDTRKTLKEDNMYYQVRDYFRGIDKNEFIRLSDYLELRGDDTYESTENVVRRTLKYLYVTHNDTDRTEKLVYDFLYHFVNEVDIIEEINPQALQTIVLKNKPNLNYCKQFTSRFKEVLTEIALNTVKVEVEYVMQMVHPHFDTKTLQPTWELPDFYTTMNYSVFMANGNFETYRICANPTCRKLFGVSVTNSKKQFCSDDCRCAVAQRKRRYKEMSKE